MTTHIEEEVRKIMGLMKLREKVLFFLIIVAILLTVDIYIGVKNEKTALLSISSGPEIRIEPVLFSADTVYELENGYNKQEDALLADYIFQRWVVGPSTGKLSLDDNNDNIDADHSQMGQSPLVDKLLAGRKSGFFVECGAANGESLSNTLFFEKKRGWTGLLIEANPLYFQEILKKNRNSYSINACLSPTDSTRKIKFKPSGLFGGIIANMDGKHKQFVESRLNQAEISVQCFPFYSIMNALGRKKIDYFSLDVEGPEIDILRTIPFEKLEIDVLSIEYRLLTEQAKIDQDGSLRKLASVRTFFAGLSGMYEEVGIIPWGTHDNEESDESKGLDVVFKRIAQN